MKMHEITIPHIFTLIAKVSDPTATNPDRIFSRKVYEAEITNLDIGSTIEAIVPMSEKDNCSSMEVLELVGYDEEMWIVTITSYNPKTQVDISKELVVFKYDS